MTVVLAGLGLLLAVAAVVRGTLFSRLQVRRMRWRTMARRTRP